MPCDLWIEMPHAYSPVPRESYQFQRQLEALRHFLLAEFDRKLALPDRPHDLTVPREKTNHGDAPRPLHSRFHVSTLPHAQTAAEPPFLRLFLH